MKTLFYIGIFLVSLSITSCNGNAQNQNTNKNKGANTKVVGSNRIEVLDFHNEHRCKSCLDIESYTKEALNTYFSKEIENGKIAFKLLNADDSKNEILVEKYQAYGSTLIINVIVDGAENAYNITDFAFLNCENKDKFINEFKQKISEQLTKL